MEGWSMPEQATSIGSVVPLRSPASTTVRAAGETAAHLASPRVFLMHHVLLWRWHFAALATTVVLAASCAVLVQYAMKLLVDTMSGPPEQAHGIWTVLGIFIGLIAFESVFWRLSGWLGCRTTVTLGVQMRLELFAYLNSQPMRFFAERLAGSLGQRITSTAGNFGALVNTMVWRIAPPAVDFIGAMVVFATVNWHMGAVLAVVVLVFTGALLLFGERGRPLHSAYAASASTVGGDLIDVISNMWAVKAFSARNREHARLEGKFEGEADIQRASWMYTEKTRIAYDVVLCVMAGGMLAWAVHLWSTRAITTGDVVVVTVLTFRILHGSRDVALALVDTVQQFGYIEDTLRVIAQEPTVVDVPCAPSLVARGGGIEFRDVSFAYGDGAKALDGVSLRVGPGEKVGIVGPSGAGKSTIIHLIQRLYDPQQGEIRIDGQPIHRVSQESLRGALAVVPQEIGLFHRTVMENIRFGRPDAPDAEVELAARAAHCEGFIGRLAEGYATVVGERGTKLSGGQRQRIGIARAFLKDAPIIIFDEATSALDTESEVEIHKNLIEQYRHRTVLAVAHRLSTLTSFDRIIVVKDGKFIEEGSPAELRRRCSFYQKMWHLQSEGLSLRQAS
jgi:ATP-binding cassette, subfamily B, bacterial